MRIRDERPGDTAAIAALVARAFAAATHSDGNEAAIVAALRGAAGLTLSLVAEDAGASARDALAGYVAFSPVTIDGVHCDWFGLGPVAVAPERQRQGIGGLLIGRGLERLAALGARGCVVLGDPGYYARFGFRSGQGLVYPGPPAACFQSLALAGDHPSGRVVYHPAFG